MHTTTAGTLAHRKPSLSTYDNKNTYNVEKVLERVTYGVPAPRRMLPPGLLLKKHDYIRRYLVWLGLTASEREITFHLLRLYAYYGKVYPKANEFIDTGGCSRRSFWRAVAKLEELGVIDRINRFLHHLQISNCYRLDKLVLCLVRYLAEHGCPFLDDFTRDIIHQTADSFWQIIDNLRVRLRDPIPLTLEA